MSWLFSDFNDDIRTDIPATSGVPSAGQYLKAIKDAVSDYSNRIKLKKYFQLEIVNGTATYDLPAGFLDIITLQCFATNGIARAASGKLVALSSQFEERYTVVDDQIMFVPTPSYSANRDLWYKAGHVLTPDPAPAAWQDGTDYDIGDTVQATSPDGITYFECTTAGISDATEPNWQTTVGDTTTDNTVTWTTRSFAYADMTYDDARIVLLKAQVLLLKFKDSQQAGKGWSYQFGDEKVDKSKVGSGDRDRIKKLNDEYLEAVAAKIGIVGARG